jgi:hypothetical protein
MCIPPFDEEPATHFALLAKLAERLGIKELSMGMSGDFVRAIQFGATYVRIGTAIFGVRAIEQYDLRSALDLRKQHREVVSRQRDAAIGRREARPREMHEDRAALPLDARPVVIAKHQHEIVEMVGALQSLGAAT